jgi:hypothetical protein
MKACLLNSCSWYSELPVRDLQGGFNNLKTTSEEWRDFPQRRSDTSLPSRPPLKSNAGASVPNLSSLPSEVATRPRRDSGTFRAPPPVARIVSEHITASHWQPVNDKVNANFIPVGTRQAMPSSSRKQTSSNSTTKAPKAQLINDVFAHTGASLTSCPISQPRARISSKTSSLQVADPLESTIVIASSEEIKPSPQSPREGRRVKSRHMPGSKSGTTAGGSAQPLFSPRNLIDTIADGEATPRKRSRDIYDMDEESPCRSTRRARVLPLRKHRPVLSKRLG